MWWMDDYIVGIENWKAINGWNQWIRCHKASEEWNNMNQGQLENEKYLDQEIRDDKKRFVKF